MEEPVTFKNKAGQTLFGILHIPDHHVELRHKVGVNLLNPGLKNRVAPNRLNVKMARALCSHGYPVLRFDPQGIGDSEGDSENTKLINIWHKIQRGYFVQDTLESNRYFIKECGLAHIVLIGACGAANTAVMAGVEDRYVDNLILIDLPVKIVSMFQDPIWIKENRDASQFSMSSDTLKLFLKNKAKHLFRKFNIPVEQYLSRDANSSGDVNWEIVNSFFQFISNRKHILLIFAEMDPALKKFNEHFKSIYLKDMKYQQMYEIIVVKDANHAYYFQDSQNVLIENTIKFLDNRYLKV